MKSRNMNVSKELANEKIIRTSGRKYQLQHARCTRQISPMQRNHSLRSEQELQAPSLHQTEANCAKHAAVGMSMVLKNRKQLLLTESVGGYNKGAPAVPGSLRWRAAPVIDL